MSGSPTILSPADAGETSSRQYPGEVRRLGAYEVALGLSRTQGTPLLRPSSGFLSRPEMEGYVLVRPLPANRENNRENQRLPKAPAVA